ncbi:MAG: UDP-N-acetylmuramoyl-L-alanine--D-glutamate ligase [Acidimicrobiales bacterium]
MAAGRERGPFVPPSRPARPAIGWSDLAGARVGLWGIRMEGLANLRRLREMGVEPVLVDDHPDVAGVGGLVVLDGSAGGLDALGECEVVVKSPGISRHGAEVQHLVDEGVAVAGGLGLWLADADRARVACLTGTKGKSTTSAIAGHLAGRLGARCLVAGNIGVPPWDPGVPDDWDWWVVETSSFQATDVAASPPVVAVTSLGPDHLDWHGDVETYYRDKLSLCSQPGATLTVADGTSEPLRARADLLGPTVRWVTDGDDALDGPWVDGLGLAGRHNRRNALIARACLQALGVPGALDDDRLAAAATGFAPLEHRFCHLGTVEDVEFVDDGLSTNVLPTCAALDALSARPVGLLVGGQDRGIDYGPIAAVLQRRTSPTFVATMPEAGRRIHAAIDAAVAGAGLSGGREGGARGAAHCGPDVEDFADLATAVQAAFAWARGRGGVVLLSPAAPSFGQFRDYRARGEAFADAMRACARTAG